MSYKQTISAKKEAKSQIGNKSAEMIQNIKKTTIKKKIFSFIIFILFAVITAIAVYSSYELYKIKSPTYQKNMIEKQTKDIIDAVAKLTEIPDDIPQIATITNVDMLKKDQPFFDLSKNGDQILIFQKEVILYRPSINKIINIGPVNRQQTGIENQQLTPSGSNGSATINPAPVKK